MQEKEVENAPGGETPEEPKFEMTPEEATAMGGGAPGLFNRKRVLVTLCISFSVVIGGGLVLNALKPPKAPGAAESGLPAANTPTDQFLASLRDRSLRQRASEPAPENAESAAGEEPPPEPPLPPVSFNMAPGPVPAPALTPAPQQQGTPPPAPTPAPQQQPAPPPEPTYYKSPLVPALQGSLLAQAAPQSAPAAQQQGGQAAGGAYGSQPPVYYAPPGGGGAAYSGAYLGENALWAGTVIPGVLETAINTDLPGSVLARVTQNVYDSQTGRTLLIPQGTILIARYGSSVSYAQHRVQIAWDTMIRPDGFQADLGGAPGVDRAGMGGQAARYDENWFEYLKAAGIVALFSVANASMTDAAARHATDASAANIAEANSQLVNQLGGSLVSRAMGIQPTLTVENGTAIDIMLSNTLYLPPAPDPAEARRRAQE